MVLQGQVIEEPFHISQLQTAEITEADGTANVWSDIWKFQVPVGQSLVLRAEHKVSMYIEDGSAEVGNGTCQLRIEIRDSSEQDRRVVFGPVQYINVKEFQDRRLIAHINVVQPVPIKERMWIVIVVNDDGTIDASDSYFDLETVRVRKTL